MCVQAKLGNCHDIEVKRLKVFQDWAQIKGYVDNPPQINDKEIARMLTFEKNSQQINENKQKLAAKK